jgi:Cd2+/Zn2+-exporting ATPase
MTAQNADLCFEIVGLDCPDCAQSLESAVAALPGVLQAQVIFVTAQLAVIPDGSRPGVAQEIVALGAAMGHQLVVRDAAAAAQATEARGWAAWLRRRRHDLDVIACGALLLGGIAAQALRAPTLLSQLLFAAAIVIGGRRVARGAWVALRSAHTLDMNALMTIAVVGAMALGEFAEGAVTILLFAIGEWLEGYSTDRARRAIRALMDLAPVEATRVVAGREERVSVEALAIGDRIVVRPGERIAMDGAVIVGYSAVDQAPITGESLPVEKRPGSQVFAGTINGVGLLTVEVSKLVKDNALSRILRLVEKAQSERAPAQRFVDRFARVYTPIVMAVALLVAVAPPLAGLGTLREWLFRGLVLLVIACPCALVISTPVTIVSALARAARSGVLIKGGRHLEALAAVRAIAFDKTGTLTLGRLQVVGGGCVLHAEMDERCLQCRDLLAKASAVEERSEHLLARTVVAHADALGLRGTYAASEQVTAYPGLGVVGSVQGHEIAIGNHEFGHPECENLDNPMCRQIVAAEEQGYTVLVAQDTCCDQRCYWAVSDTLRPEAPRAVEALRKLGVREVIVLTGDNPQVAERVANAIGSDRTHASLLPQQKLALVQDLQQRWGTVAMVGDGINDAPALARATVGIAMGGAGADAALETADVTLMGDDLMRLPYAVRLSKRAMRVVRANIAFALGLKAVFMLLAVMGLSTLWMAVLADTGAALLVTLNGARLLMHRDATV